MSGLPKYQASIDRSNKNNSHTLSIDFIEINGHGQPLEILEVGCSTGYFGSALQSLGHSVIGVEMDEASSSIARSHLGEVHCCTIQDYFLKNPQKRFDVITFGDVLEHLTDPESVLKSTLNHLKPGGRLVASIPNVTHASIRCMLLQGDWTYSDLGILDRTHLRFFSKETLLDMLGKSGFTATHVQAVKLSAQHAAEMCGLTLQPEYLKSLEFIRDDDTAENFQYVISAVATQSAESAKKQASLARKRSLRILATCDNPDSTIAKIRVTVPLQGFANEGCRSLRVTTFDAATQQDIDWADVIVIQRGAGPSAEVICEKASRAGKPIIYEIDDLLTELPDFLAHHQGYIKNKKIIENLIRSATVVTLTNNNLAEALRHLNSSLEICPNYFEVLARATPPKHDPSPKADINLIIASSDRVRMDMISPALVALKREHGDRIKIQAIGPIADTLQAQGVVCNKMDLIPHDEFVSTVGSFTNAIGIIPLDDSKFSSCKSPVKYFDYSQAGLVSICSDVSPYMDIIENGKTGVLCKNNTESWIEELSKLIGSPSLRLELALNAQQQVREKHNLQKTIDAWTAVFERVAPDDVAIYVTPPPLPKRTKLESLVQFLQTKNRQRKVRRNQRKFQKKAKALQSTAT